MKYTMEDLAFLKNGRAQQHKSSEPVTRKVCVVSGATSGVGLVAVKQLARGGAKLVLVGRSQQKLEQVKAQLERDYATSADLVVADFARLADVRRAAEEINARYDVIDILINSAGIHSTKRLLSEDGNELVFQVNHLRRFLLPCCCWTA
ncbi:MAG: SDR family NAD(P)-dependent oxidoreductase [Eubacteriales bacterium]